MASYGFVYMLSNRCMPNMVKIGCTERSPHARAEELSRPTGVPTAFEVVCYIEVEEPFEVESWMHQLLRRFRVEDGREFFWALGATSMENLYGLFRFYPGRLSFTDVSSFSFFAGSGIEAETVRSPYEHKASSELFIEAVPVAANEVD